MKLQEAIIMGRFCGLKTINECLHNADLHYFPTISYLQLTNERAELYTEVLQYYAGELELEWDYINAEVAKLDAALGKDGIIEEELS